MAQINSIADVQALLNKESADLHADQSELSAQQTDLSTRLADVNAGLQSDADQLTLIDKINTYLQQLVTPPVSA